MQIGLEQPLLIQVSGSEASKILNNLTTNQVLGIEVGAATETFITDVRGWVVAHGIVSHLESDVWWLLGQHPEPSRVANHIDRYIVRENAQVSNLSDGYCIGLRVALAEHADERVSSELPPEFRRIPFHSFDPSAELIVAPKDSESSDRVSQSDVAASQSDLALWDQERIVRLWPRMGIDIWEKCIPQELDRTSQAICFSKGCYLGQETIARLDALGQIQKKLCLLKIHSTEVPIGSLVLSENQEVGTVTSAIALDRTTWALAVIRRGHFVTGTQLNVNCAPAVVSDVRRA